MGLIFNAFMKIPLQFFILFIGLLLFVFYSLNQPPLNFNKSLLSYQKSIDNLKKNGLYIIEDVGWRYMDELVKYFNKQRDTYNYELVILKSEKMNNDNNLMVIRRTQ